MVKDPFPGATSQKRNPAQTEREVKGTYNEARVQGNAWQEDKDPIVPRLCL